MTVVYKPITVELVDHMGDDYKRVADIARTSFKDKAANYTDDRNIKLTKYLADHDHWTPFGGLQVTIRVELPLWLHAQYVTHKVGVVNNTMSRRYVRDKLEMYKPVFRAVPKAGIKQGSGGLLPSQDLAAGYHLAAMEQALNYYHKLLDLGVAPEQARGVLPTDTMTTVVSTGSILFFARMYHQRCGRKGHPQKEWLHITDKLNEIMNDIWPVSWNHLINKEKQ